MISRLVSIAIQIKAAKGMLANCKPSQYNWSRLSPSARAVHRKKEETWIAIVETLEGAEASEARTADLLKALEGLLSPDKMSVYGTMDKIAAAWAAIAAAKGETV